MAGTRSSARIANGSSPTTESGTKRKADDSSPSSSAKKGRKIEKEQKTIEETMSTDNQEADQAHDTEMKDSQDGNGDASNGGSHDTTRLKKMHGGETTKDDSNASSTSAPAGHEGGPTCWFWLDNETYVEKDADGTEHKKTIKAGETWQGKNKEGEDATDPEKALKDSRGGPGLNALPVDKPAKDDVPYDDAQAHDASSTEAASGAVEQSKDRADAMPSNIMEKGIIYFFTRGRVGIENPENVTDLQRSYFVLRPLAPGAKLTDGAIDDIGNNRLFALPKKVWPKGPQDKFMAFVEQAKSSMDNLKKSFFEGSTYDTKTVGTRHTPSVTPMAEGVYAMTKAGDRDETHLSYMLTIPKNPGEMQEDIGIRSKGSFVLSLKNPTVKGPAYASLPQGAEFPKEYIEEFSGRGWMPVQPKHLDYENAQILLIGESYDSSHALDATAKDEKSEVKETPAEELEKLEGEDELRVEHLRGDDSVFDDLHVSSKDYPSVPTTW